MKSDQASTFKKSAKIVLTDRKQYISFFLAFIIVQSIFWTLTITTGINNRHVHESLTGDYKYHVIISDVTASQWNTLYNKDKYYKDFKPGLWPTVEKISDVSANFEERKITVGLTLGDVPRESLNYFKAVNNSDKIGLGEEQFTLTPLYTDDPYIIASGLEVLFTILAIVFFILFLLFFSMFSRLGHPKLDDESGERIYRSTASENFRNLLRGASLVLTLITILAALVFFIIRLTLGNKPIYFFLYLFLILICTAFLTELFNVRINHHKFRYGIYMTFGAGFGKLYGTSVCEMLVVSAISLLPSLALSMCAVFLIYAGGNVTVFLPFSAIVGVVILNLIVIFVCTYIPMKSMAVKAPITLLYAEDNSNLVTSPRRSFKLYGKNFPWAYEAYGMWRFRKYFVRMVAVAVSFTTIFLCGIYLSGTTGSKTDTNVCEFTVTANDEYLTSDEIEVIAGMLRDAPGFEYLYWNDSRSASSLRSHIMINSENIAISRNVYDIENGSSIRRQYYDLGYNGTTDSLYYTAYNKTLIDSLYKMYDVVGDPYAVLEDNRKIIVSEYLNNIKCFDFKVGDKVIVAIPDFVVKIDEDLVKGGRYGMALKKMIEQSSFFYREYEVAAIVNDSGSDGHILFGVGESSYSELIIACSSVPPSPFMSSISVFGSKDATPDDFEKLSLILNSEFGLFDYTVRETYGMVNAKLYGEGAHHAIIITVSLLIMVISPLIWFFSQRNFYKRRSKEIFVLRALGCEEARIKRLYLSSGIILAALSAVMTLAMSYIADFIIYIFGSFFLFDSTSGAAVEFYMPPAALIACLASAIICGFFSSVLPYIMSQRQSKAEFYNTED